MEYINITLSRFSLSFLFSLIFNNNKTVEVFLDRHSSSLRTTESIYWLRRTGLHRLRVIVIEGIKTLFEVLLEIYS